MQSDDQIPAFNPVKFYCEWKHLIADHPAVKPAFTEYLKETDEKDMGHA